MSKTIKKVVTEGIRGAKEGVAECWDDMGGQTMTQGQQQMSVTISMPGKNISVTTDSAEEIGNILRLAGIEIGSSAPAQEPAGIAVEIPGMGTEAPEQELVPMGAQTMGGMGGMADEPETMAIDMGAEEPGSEEMPGEDEDEVEEGWDDMMKAGRERAGTQPNGESGVKQGTRYGGGRQDEKPAEKEKEVDESILALQKLAGIVEGGKPQWLIDKEKAAEGEEESEEEVDESIVGQGVYEAEGDEEDKEDDAAAEKRTGMSHAEWEKSEEDKEEDAMQEAARIISLSGITEWANSPEGKATDKGTVSSKLPSNVGQGGGNSQFGQNRANGQGENPMSVSQTPDNKAIDVEEAFAKAMGEYRKFVSESIASKK